MISCLMVALPTRARLACFKLSVQDFLRQTLAHKELVVVLNGADRQACDEMKGHIAGLRSDSVRVIDVPGALNLGTLRNLSIRAARGKYVCQWDDDDRHHPDRLKTQFEALQVTQTSAVLLEEVVHAFPAERNLFCLNWRSTEWRGFPGSLLCAPNDILYPEKGEEASRGEDIAVLRHLSARGGYITVPRSPHLYIYASHGQNTWSSEHHRMLADSLALSRAMLLRREQDLRAGLAPFADALAGMTMQGSNGPAFAI